MPKLDNILPDISSKNFMISYRKPITFYLRPLANDRVAIVSDHGLT